MNATQKKKSPLNNVDEQLKLKMLGDAVMDNFHKVIAHFNLDLKETNRMFVGGCPIHGGNKRDAFNIYHSGDTTRGNWYCRTKSCERTFVGSPVGLVRGLLSRYEHKWEDVGDKTVDFATAKKWCLDLVNTDFDSFKVDTHGVEEHQFVMQSKILGYKRPTPKYSITRDTIRKSLIMPADYFINRGFNPDVLDEYDVGVCLDPKKRMYSRAVVPVYDDNYKFMVGCTGRSLFEECPRCEAYHNPKAPCPREEDRWKYSKWKHSPDFDADEYLYNYWKAWPMIQTTGVALIVESPGNCWRAVEAGYKNVLGTFGAKLSSGQKTLLDSSGAMTLIVLTDGDAAGKVARANIVTQCENTYTLITPNMQDGMDLANLSIKEVKAMIDPIMKKYSNG